VTAQVVFLNKWLDCPSEVKRYHQQLQWKIQEAKATFEYETRDYSLYQKQLSKMMSQNLVRDRLKVIPGGISSDSSGEGQ
jgi:hypothetical protein